MARRGVGSTSPNPPVGAVVVCGDEIAGEGWHHRAGEPHAEVLALQQAGERARSATLYVTLEPCNHFGRTPPCSHAVAASGVARVVAGALDPNPRTAGGGVAYLRERGILVEVAQDAAALELIAPFTRAVRSHRPFVTLKMAMSLDGFVASGPGKQEWLTGEEARGFVRELRIAHDAVLVGAGTVRTDDPQLTVRPPHHRERPYLRAVVSKGGGVDERSRVFQPVPGYAPTLLYRDAEAALRDLHDRGVSSVLCEGGPALAAYLLQARLADRVLWLLAPRLLRAPHAVPVLAGGSPALLRGLRFERVERLGGDVLIAGSFGEDV